MTSLRRVASVVITGAALAGGLSALPASATSPPNDEKPPPKARVSLQAASDGTARAVVDGVLTYRVDSGFDLDQYLWHEDSPLEFSIDISDYFGPVDGEGRPAPGHALYGDTSLLTLRAFDVDEIHGEIDRVVVNGVRLDGQLSGADNQWATDTFSFPAELLRFPSEEGGVATNDFQILIDESNAGWAVEIDWAELRPAAGHDGMRPVAFLHGITANQSSWSKGESSMANMKFYFTERDSRGGPRSVAPQLTKNRSIERNVAILGPVVDELIAGDPYQQIDIVAHSMGGLAARQYAFDNPGKVRKIVMLGTPNAGSNLANVLCANRNTPWWLKRGGEHLADYLSRDFGPCKDENDGAFQLQTHYIKEIFNRQVPDRPSVDYATIAGDSGGLGSILLGGADDGTVSVSSVRHLAAGGANGGLHTSLMPSIDTDHMGLIYEQDSGAELRAFCYLYGEHKDCLGIGDGVGGGGGGGGTWRMAAAPISDELSPQNAGGVADAVEPGETRTYPLSVGADEAAELVVLAEDGLMAGVDGVAFEPASFFDAPAIRARFTGPTSLTVTNESNDLRAFQAYLLVESERALTLDVPTFVRAGAEVEITAQISGSLPEDVVEFSVSNADGEVAAGSMAAVGNGRWTTTLTAPAGGAFNVTAWVDGAQPRTVNSPLVVGSGGSIGNTFVESIDDVDADGLIDHLDLTVPVRVDAAGDYRLAGRLVDAAGNRVGEAGVTSALSAGESSLTLRFDGRSLHDSARPGPWRLLDVTLSDAAMHVMDITDLGETSAFDPAQFEHDQLTVSDFADEPVDVDDDGLFDVLRISAQVDSEEFGNYAVNGKLVAQDGREVARAQTSVFLDAGVSTVAINFDGASIGASGADGPYVLRDFTVYPMSSPSGGLALVDAHVTAPYRSAQFPGGTEPDTPPIADFTTTAADGLRVTFDGTPSSDDHGIVEYTWDLGDGTTASGSVVEHRYAAAGDYVVTVHVTDTAGQRAQQTVTVVVQHTCQGVPATIVADGRGLVLGTSGADVIVGTARGETILAGAGNNLVCAGGGDDIVLGGPGADVVYGGEGNDMLVGGPGDDRLFGEAGNDLLDGGPGNDELVGGQGLDLLLGGPGRNRLTA